MCSSVFFNFLTKDDWFFVYILHFTSSVKINSIFAVGSPMAVDFSISIGIQMNYVFASRTHIVLLYSLNTMILTHRSDIMHHIKIRNSFSNIHCNILSSVSMLSDGLILAFHFSFPPKFPLVWSSRLNRCINYATWNWHHFVWWVCLQCHLNSVFFLFEEKKKA